MLIDAIVLTAFLKFDNEASRDHIGPQNGVDVSIGEFAIDETLLARKRKHVERTQKGHVPQPVVGRIRLASEVRQHILAGLSEINAVQRLKTGLHFAQLLKRGTPIRVTPR